MNYLRQFFMEEHVDFQKRCRMRIGVSIFLFLLGGLSLSFAFGKSYISLAYPGKDLSPFFSGFYKGTGFGLMAASLITIYRNLRYLKNPETGKKRNVYENDERNRMLGLRCWAYAGYSFFVILYIGIFVSGFINPALTQMLLLTGGIYGILLLAFRLLLRRCM